MNISRTLSLAVLLGFSPLLALAQGDDLLRVWSTPGVSARERAAVVNRAFTNGTPIPLIVAKLGTNYTRCTPRETSALEYNFGRESVVVETTAAPGESLLSATFTRAGFGVHDAPKSITGTDLVVMLLSGAGFICAFCCLLVATFARSANTLSRHGLYFFVLLALLLQTGCWAVGIKLENIDPGPNSDVYAARLRRIWLAGVGVAFVWGLILEWSRLKRGTRRQRENRGTNGLSQ